MKPTREKVLAEPAGKKMNAWVAEFAMGLKPGKDGWWLHPILDTWQPTPRYSEDIAAAWEVVEKMGDMFDSLERGNGGTFWMCTLYPDLMIPMVVRGKTAPLAICRASLLAKLEQNP